MAKYLNHKACFSLAKKIFLVSIACSYNIVRLNLFTIKWKRDMSMQKPFLDKELTVHTQIILEPEQFPATSNFVQW